MLLMTNDAVSVFAHLRESLLMRESSNEFAISSTIKYLFINNIVDIRLLLIVRGAIVCPLDKLERFNNLCRCIIKKSMDQNI